MCVCVCVVSTIQFFLFQKLIFLYAKDTLFLLFLVEHYTIKTDNFRYYLTSKFTLKQILKGVIIFGQIFIYLVTVISMLFI